MEAMHEKKECRWKLFMKRMNADGSYARKEGMQMGAMHEKNECRWKLCMKRMNADGSYA